MQCSHCNTEFELKPWPTTHHKYCSIICGKRAYKKRHHEELREKWREYQQNHRAKVLNTKRKYNNSPKGIAAHARYLDTNRERIHKEYLELYHTDAGVKAIHIARGTSRRRLKRIRPDRQCVECGWIEGRIECHHKDGNPLNTLIGNLEWLCHRCHMAHHSEGGGVFPNES